MPSIGTLRWSVSVALAMGVAAGPASAGLSQSTISAPGGFAQAGAYSSACGCGMTAGSDMAAQLGTPQDFEELAFAGINSAQASAAYAGGSISNSANMTVALGVFRPYAENSAPWNAQFPQGIGNGGWKESFTVNNAARTGQAGYLVFEVRARGTLRATGWAGAASLVFTPYKDGIALATNAYFDPGNSDAIGSSSQYGYWGVATYGPGEVVDRTIDGVVTMAVPITFGQSFTLGVYGLANAGMRSSASTPAICTSRCDFSGDGITWNGIADILDSAGQPVAGSTIVSGSGIDWSGPHAEPTGVTRADDASSMSLRLANGTASQGAVRFELVLPHAANVRVGVYDARGRQIRTLADGWRAAGRNDLVWDGKTREGVTAGSGVCFVRAEWEGSVVTQRLVRLR